MKKIITLVSIALAITVNAQQMPTVSILRPQFGVGVKTRFPTENVRYTNYGHFGAYVEELDARPEIYLSTSCFILPNSLRLDLEFPLRSFLENPSSGWEVGLSAGLTYQFLGKSSVGIHPIIGTSIKRYSYRGGIMVVPLTIGVNYQKNWFGLELSYQRFFQNKGEDLQLYKSAVDLSFNYLFGKKQVVHQVKSAQNKFWRVGAGVGTLGTQDEFYLYTSLSLDYQFNSSYTGSLNFQVFDQSESESQPAIAAMLNLVKTWNTKGFLMPDFGISIGYVNLDYVLTGPQYGFVGGVTFVPSKAPRFSFRSSFGLRATPYMYKRYHFNTLDFNILQASYRL